MSIFSKILGFKSKSENEENSNQKDQSKFMPEEKIPTDENFMINFKKNGGKFLYCSDKDEMLDAFYSILKENNWENSKACCFDENLKATFKDFNLDFNKSSDSSFFLSTSEYLIANTGALLISSNQIGEKKLNELPHDFIILAATSQLIDTIGEGLRGIKHKSKNRIPSNITTIKTFEDKKESDFMSYGSPSKNLYLLLLEDL
ncbi:LUD domain-containing protein [Mesonia sp. K4-1]|jgi:L-lactate utilization protein LutC|uniref:LUD domain-containing protein n=1 Tax=Mesonia sp. K4-1 TaxID=2602760 RepID=UPI0011C7AED8|nr:LUD domain-containing protein [Mesonia sp. K4-1]TXK74971.1 lactate utilization protein B/C [Mesonia sp. K4-1]